MDIQTCKSYPPNTAIELCDKHRVQFEQCPNRPKHAEMHYETAFECVISTLRPRPIAPINDGCLTVGSDA